MLKGSFLTHVPCLSALPPMLEPEIAFWGRSNVGKSSLINGLLAGSPARTSKRPGCTQGLNFYHVPPGLRLVDLPGYGFAKVPLALKAQWEALVLFYLQNRPCLWKIYLLIDSRHEMTQADKQTLQFLSKLGKPHEVRLTKIDCISKALLLQRTEAFSKRFPKVPISGISAKTREGMDALEAALRVFCGPLSNSHVQE